MSINDTTDQLVPGNDNNYLDEQANHGDTIVVTAGVMLAAVVVLVISGSVVCVLGKMEQLMRIFTGAETDRLCSKNVLEQQQQTKPMADSEDPVPVPLRRSRKFEICKDASFSSAAMTDAIIKDTISTITEDQYSKKQRRSASMKKMILGKRRGIQETDVLNGNESFKGVHSQPRQTTFRTSHNRQSASFSRETAV